MAACLVGCVAAAPTLHTTVQPLNGLCEDRATFRDYRGDGCTDGMYPWNDRQQNINYCVRSNANWKDDNTFVDDYSHTYSVAAMTTLLAGELSHQLPN